MEKKYTINGKTWIIEYDPGTRQVVDVNVHLTREEYLALKRKLSDPEINFKNSASIEILKNGFAKARGEAAIESAQHTKPPTELTLSKFLDKLEDKGTISLEKLSRSINGRYSNPSNKIKELERTIMAYAQDLSQLRTELSQLLSASSLSEAQKNIILNDVKALTQILETNNVKFLSQLSKLKGLGRKLTHEDVDVLLSAQDRGNAYSLGHFLGDQTSAICNSAISITSVIQNRYLLDVYYKKNEVTTAFIEASSELRIRHESHYGARYVNTQTSAQDLDALPNEADFSVLPFMSGTTVSDLDKMICLVSEASLSQRSLSMPSKTWRGLFGYGLRRAGTFVGLYTVAPVLELALTGFHLALALPATVLRVLAYPLVATGVLKHDNFLDKYIENLNAIHRFISPVRGFKSLWNAQYKRLDDAGNPVTNAHQQILSDYNVLKNESAIVNATDAITDPQNTLSAIRLGFHLGYQAVGTIGRSLGSLLTTPLRVFKRSPSDEEIFKKYDENYHLLKPVMEALVSEAEKSSIKLGGSPSKFPGAKRQIDYSAESPARVINEVMYLLNDKVIHHLAENHPGPATFFFILSVATFGSNFAPIGALAWMHGAPGYFKLVQSGLAQAFTGYSGPMTGSTGMAHGSIAALLQFKLFTVGSSALLSSADKNNDILEHMAKNPEEIIAGFVAFVGVGYAMGYVPHIPSVPSSFSFLGHHISTQVNGINPFDGYSMIFNSITTEAADARAGLLLFPALEYGFLGYKTLLWVNSMTLDGKSAATPREIALVLDAFKEGKILSLSETERDKEIESILKKTGNKKFSSPSFITKMKTHMTRFINEDTPTLKRKLESTTQAIAQERAEWDQLIHHQPDVSYDTLSSYDKLQRAIKMLSDKDVPCTFTKKSDAIQYYNQLSRTFDQYNKDVVKGVYPGHNAIPKEDFLQAFRNKHIATGSNNLLRLLSFYPGYPLRLLWREAQLRFNGSPYVVDKINASREKDVVLRNDWVAIAKMSAYNFANLFNKAIKATIGAVPTVIIVGLGVMTNIGLRITGQPLDFTKMGVRLQQLGRLLDNIAIQNLIPWSSQRTRFAEAAHASSRYDDLIGAGEKVSERLVENAEKITFLQKRKDSVLSTTEGQEISHQHSKKPTATPAISLNRASITAARKPGIKTEPEPTINDTDTMRRRM